MKLCHFIDALLIELDWAIVEHQSLFFWIHLLKLVLPWCNLSQNFAGCFLLCHWTVIQMSSISCCVQICFLSQFVQAFCVLEISLIVIVIALLLNGSCLTLGQIPFAKTINSHCFTRELVIIVSSPTTWQFLLLLLVFLVVERTVALLTSASVDLPTRLTLLQERIVVFRWTWFLSLLYTVHRLDDIKFLFVFLIRCLF